MKYDYDIQKLTTAFFEDYPSDIYPELMNKLGRPYNCLLLETHYDYYICIPFRSNIHHKQAFLFKDSRRSRQTRSGLDYSKMVIIKNADKYLTNQNVAVDNDEYNEAQRNIERIVFEALDYLDSYIEYVKNGEAGNANTRIRFKYSTLRYFNDILL